MKKMKRTLIAGGVAFTLMICAACGSKQAEQAASDEAAAESAVSASSAAESIAEESPAAESSAPESVASESRDAKIAQVIADYVKANNLDITKYQLSGDESKELPL